MKATVKLHGITLEIEEPKEIDTLHKACALMSCPSFCKLCRNGDNFSLQTNKDKDANVYINVLCRKCGARAKLGQYKSGGYFWHEFEQWKKDGTVTPNTTVKSEPVGYKPIKSEPLPEPPIEDLPF